MAAGLWSIAEAKVGRELSAGSQGLGYTVGVTAWLLTAGVTPTTLTMMLCEVDVS